MLEEAKRGQFLFCRKVRADDMEMNSCIHRLIAERHAADPQPSWTLMAFSGNLSLP
jgi:hypothetical protein